MTAYRSMDGWSMRDPQAYHAFRHMDRPKRQDLFEDGMQSLDGCAETYTMDWDRLDMHLDGEILELLSQLKFVERLVIELRYGIPDGFTYTFKEIGEILGRTRERARQLHARAIWRLQFLVSRSINYLKLQPS